jgi:predicted phage terminase large subunit-like protein
MVLDDLENDKNVKNPRLVKELLDWIKSTVYPAIDVGGNLFWIGTILNRRSALDIALRADEEPWKHWTRRLFRAIQEDGTSLWPALHPIEKLLKQKQMMGTLAFNREKMNSPVDEEGMFREEWFRYYHPADLLKVPLVVVGYFDPSIESGASADFKAIITVGLDVAEMVYYVLDAFIRRASIDRAIDAAYVRHQQYSYLAFGVEDNLFQKLLLREFDRAAQEKKLLLPLKGVTSTLSKETRVSGLSPLVERGRIRFCRGQSDQDLLIEQLLFVPSPTVNDDGPDALEGAVRMLATYCFEAADVQAEPEAQTYRSGRAGGFRNMYPRMH